MPKDTHLLAIVRVGNLFSYLVAISKETYRYHRAKLFFLIDTHIRAYRSKYRREDKVLTTLTTFLVENLSSFL